METFPAESLANFSEDPSEGNRTGCSESGRAICGAYLELGELLPLQDL